MSGTIQLRPRIKDASFAIGSALACAVPSAVSAPAVSAPGQVLERAYSEFLSDQEESIALFGKKAQALSELAEVADEASEDDWDGYGALPLLPEGVELAKAFIRALPEGVAMPAPCPEPDGEVALEWYGGKTRILSVSFGKGDRLAYAYLNGTNRSKGVQQFDGGVVDSLLLELIEKMA